MSRRTWFALAVVAILLGGGGGWLAANQRAGAEDAAGCAGLSDYRENMLRVGQDEIDLRVSQQIGPDRDIATFSSAEWATFADIALQFQNDLKEIAAPDFAAEWHQSQIEGAGLLEQAARLISTEGIMSAVAFSDQFTANEDKRSAAFEQAVAACPDFAAFQSEWDGLDGSVESDAEVTRVVGEDKASVASIPIGVTGDIGNGWVVRVEAIFRSPELIDPTADWFLKWLDANPRAEGTEFFTVRVAITNNSAQAGDVLQTLGFGLKSETGFRYDSADSCGGVPDRFGYDDQLDVGESIEGNICWVVRTNQMPTLKLTVEDWTSFNSKEVVFDLDVAPSGTPAT